MTDYKGIKIQTYMFNHAKSLDLSTGLTYFFALFYKAGYHQNVNVSLNVFSSANSG